MKRLVALLLVSVLPASGCSWIFMTRAPEPVAVPNYPVQCSDSNAAPILDTICAAYFVANTAALASAKDCESAAPGQKCIKSSDRSTAIGIDLGIIGLCAVSAYSGYTGAARCSEVKTQNALCITGNDQACRNLNPAWTRPPLQPPPGYAPPPPPAAVPLPPPPPPPPGTAPAPQTAAPPAPAEAPKQ